MLRFYIIFILLLSTPFSAFDVLRSQFFFVQAHNPGSGTLVLSSSSGEFSPFEEGSTVSLTATVQAPLNSQLELNSSYNGRLVHDSYSNQKIDYSIGFNLGSEFSVTRSSWSYRLSVNIPGQASSSFGIVFTLGAIADSVLLGHYTDSIVLSLSD